MAISPAHKFGQIIGETLETAILPLLERFARAHSLYLDKKGSRSCRSGKKCSWLDLNGNSHDLDYVLERGGTDKKVGIPVAFIETAWRRYTKHSRNKAQEIQGAVIPLSETYRNSAPFKGAVLGGVFTKGALEQLRSLGFNVVYLSYASIVGVFDTFGIDARYEEDTKDSLVQKKVNAYERLTQRDKRRLATALTEAHRDQIDEFFRSLSSAVLRQVERIVVLALHGKAQETSTIEDAIRFIEEYVEVSGVRKPVDRYEIRVRYNNGNVIEGRFTDKASAIDFLRSYQPIRPKVK